MSIYQVATRSFVHIGEYPHIRELIKQLSHLPFMKKLTDMQYEIMFYMISMHNKTGFGSLREQEPKKEKRIGESYNVECNQ